ncbi:MAG: NADPH-dependent FMN reductase [Bacteroidota bacterium]
MPKSIVAFGASNSTQSINKRFASYAAHQIADAEINLLDLNDYEMPIYSMDREKASGIPAQAQQFLDHLRSADGIVISFAEHNGAYSAAFKNIFDWVSRIDNKLWGDKPMLLLATSPGGRGGQTVLDIAKNKFKFMNTNTLASFSLPLFHQHFSEEEGIKDEALKASFEAALQVFVQALG